MIFNLSPLKILNLWTANQSQKPAKLRIVGLATQWPELQVGPEVLDEFIRRWYEVDGKGHVTTL